MAKIDKVRDFWDKNHLFKDELDYDKNFYNKVDNIYINNIFDGSDDIKKRIFFPNPNQDTLDLGCGIGFWTNFIYENYTDKIIAADISEKSLKIAKNRYKINNNIKFQLENAEKLSFPNQYFDHINCQGVIHHTEKTNDCAKEIYRVLKIKGTCSISVYYDNFFIRHYNLLFIFFKLFFKLFGIYKGRGRNFANLPKNVDDIVRLYDGVDNPIGKSYSKKEFMEILVKAGFSKKNIKFKFYYFPFRFLGIKLKLLHNLLVYLFPFLIIANITK